MTVKAPPAPAFSDVDPKLGKELVWGCLGPEAPRRSTGGWTTGERKGEAIAEHARTCL